MLSDNTPPPPEDAGEGAENTDFDIEALEFELENSASEADRTAERIEEFFAPGGTLLSAAKLDGRPCEFRPQQAAMARAVTDAMTSGHNLAVEAPTGVGKSFAYLVPLVMLAARRDRPAVVSTETINLQEQLMDHDIPLLRKLTGIDFRAALAKGRGNYLCLRRLALLAGEQSNQLLPAESLKLDLERIVQWAETSETGERGQIDFRMDNDLWPLICCEAGNCQKVRCPFFQQCFYMRARKKWGEADIVVANHALFFTDLAMRGEEGGDSGLLPNYGALVIDEAHTLEDNAAEYLGIRISRFAVLAVLNRLYNPENARGLLLKDGADVLALRQTAAEARDEAYGFFEQFNGYLREGAARYDGRECSARRVHHTDRFEDHLSEKLMVLHRLLWAYIEKLDDDDGKENASFKTELETQLDRCKAFIDGIRTFMEMSQTDAVYYVEAERNGGTAIDVAPLNVAEILNRVLFNAPVPVTLCSATLTVRGSFDFYCGRVGFDNGSTLCLDSPFSRDQAKVLVSRDMPEPNSSEYVDFLAREIQRFVTMTGGRAFVLFTSYAHLRQCAEKLRSFFSVNDIRLLIQGGDLSRTAMLKVFREDVTSVLFGTDSFWTGVDVPGEALSNVIITKLPFPSPGDPIVEGRCEKLKAAGLSDFREYMLPAAVLKFRQGAGRLIRGCDDRGIIVVLDRRVISKGYGKTFLDALPYPLAYD